MFMFCMEITNIKNLELKNLKFGMLRGFVKWKMKKSKILKFRLSGFNP